MVIADKGYRGDETVLTPYDAVEPQVLHLMARARYRHEGINGMFKTFRILRDVFRHDRSMHESVVKCVAVFVQVKLMRGEGSYPVVEYNMSRPDVPVEQNDEEDEHDVVLMVANGPVELRVNNDNNNNQDAQLVTQDEVEDED